MKKGLKNLLKYIGKCAAVGFLVGSIYSQGTEEGRDAMFDQMHDSLEGATNMINVWHKDDDVVYTVSSDIRDSLMNPKQPETNNNDDQ